MSKTDPPFRADHVGSLLRTPVIHEGRQQLCGITVEGVIVTTLEPAGEVKARIAEEVWR